MLVAFSAADMLLTIMAIKIYLTIVMVTTTLSASISTALLDTIYDGQKPFNNV